MAEVIDIRSQLNREDTLKSVSEIALKGLEYYVRLKGQESRFDATQALKIAGEAVKSLDWKESTEEDFNNANLAVEALSSPELLKKLSPANKEALKIAVGLNNKKIMQERNLKMRADDQKAKMEGYWNELEGLKDTPLGLNQYDISESLKILESIRAVNESNIGEIGKALTEESAEGILQAQRYHDARVLLDSVDLDTNEAGIQTSLMNSKAYKDAFEFLGLVQTGENLETGEVTFDTEDKTVIDTALNPDSPFGKSWSEATSSLSKTITINEINESKGSGENRADEVTEIITSDGENWYFDNSHRVEEADLNIGDRLDINYMQFENVIYEATKKSDELSTWNIEAATKALTSVQDAQKAFSEDISQFDTGEIIGIVDEGINAKSLGSTEQITSKKIIDYYFSGKEPNTSMPNYESEMMAFNAAAHLKNQFLEGDTPADRDINDEMIGYRSDLYEKGVTAFETQQAQEGLKNNAISRINVAFSNMDGIRLIDEKSEEFSPTMATDAKRTLLKEFLDNVDFGGFMGIGADEFKNVPKMQDLKDAFDEGKDTDRIMKQLADEFIGVDGNSELKRGVLNLFFEGNEFLGGGDAPTEIAKFYEILRAFKSIEMVYPSSTDIKDTFAE